jgi:glycosyltransferase involved in cell wall biosynthesis
MPMNESAALRADGSPVDDDASGEDVPAARKPLKIAVIAACPFPYPRGTPVRIQRLSDALGGRGHDVHVFTYHLGEAASSDRFTIHRSLRVPTYSKYSPGPSLQKLLVVNPLLVAKLVSGLASERFDVIHAHHYEGLLIAKAARAGRPIPLIYDAHTLLGSELPFFAKGSAKKLGARLGVRLDRSLPRMADHIVTVTETIKSKLLAYGIPEEKITVITNGVESDLFRVDASPSRSEVRRTVIFTGNLASYQGVDNLLFAFAKVAEKRPDVRLLVVTNSSFEPYERQAAELGIRGRIDLSSAPFSEHGRLLAGAAVAVNPRIDCDGIPQKLLNYMAAGRPTVSFAGSAPCIEHGDTGWVVANGDIDAFAGGLLKLLDDPALADRLGQAAQAAVASRFTWQVAAEKAERLYRRTLDERVRA